MSAPDSTHLARVLADLSEPAAYSHPAGSVRVRQTHISCVFLTGEYAYKVKKPVDFGFVDYTTLERRLRFCRDEITLNQRLCPEVYLDVLPVVEREGRLRVGGEGEVVDWAVRMRELPEREMLPERLAEGTVTPRHMADLGRLLADFHAAAERGPVTARWGQPERIASIQGQCLPDRHLPVHPWLPSEQRAAIEAYLAAFRDSRAPLLRQRAEGGFTRAGHGDLRLQNICLAPEIGCGIQVFDCIEFTDEFRILDVLSDLAYLVMDLDLAGHAALRRDLVRTYQDGARDPDLEILIPFYCCFRACVRGKIALLAANEDEVPAAERQEHRVLAARAFDLARSYSARRRRPALVLTAGFSGSGKSVLARELARRLPAIRLSSDEVRKELAGATQTQRLGGAAYGRAGRRAVYEELFRRADPLLQAGEHVLLDATFLDPDDREAAALRAARHGAELWLIECRCPDALLRERLTRREAAGTDASDAGLRVLELQQRASPPISLPGCSHLLRAEHVVADTSAPALETARAVLERFW